MSETLNKEDFRILTAYVNINHPSKPSLRKPIQCISLIAYETLEREFSAMRQEHDAALAAVRDAAKSMSIGYFRAWNKKHAPIIALANKEKP